METYSILIDENGKPIIGNISQDDPRVKGGYFNLHKELFDELMLILNKKAKPNNTMETKELAYKLMKWLPMLQTGITLEYKLSPEKTVYTIESVKHLIDMIEVGHEIRIKQTKPKKTMNTKELADELMIWLPKLSAGKTLEVTFSDGMIAKITGIVALAENVNAGNEIRIKQTPITPAPDADERSLERKEIDIANYFMERGHLAESARKQAKRLTSGKVPHVGLK